MSVAPFGLVNLFKKAKSYVDDMDNSIVDTVDKYMCRVTCPCVPVNFMLWPEPLRD
jgi:hypothetical protein